MSKKEIISVKSFKTLKNLKIQDPTPIKSKKNISSTDDLFSKRKDKRILKSIKNIPLSDDSEIHEHFTLIPKQQNSIDKNLLIKSLTPHFVFATLIADKSIRSTLIEQFKLCRVAEGEYLMKKHDEASCFFILHDGKMCVEVDGQIKKKIFPGECFGELALLYSCVRSASIKAERNSYLWYIDRKTFKIAIEENIKKNFQENRKFIQKNQFFEYLTPSQKDKIASISMAQKFERNSKLFNEGDWASCMYIVKEGTLKRLVNGVNIGTYDKGQSLEEYAVLSHDCLRKQTVTAITNVEVIALSIDQIEEVLGKSLPIIILRNKLKKELKQHEICSQLDNDYTNKILDTFQVKNVLKNEKVCHPGLKYKEMIFTVIQGNYEISKNTENEIFGLQSFNQVSNHSYYDFEIKFLEEGKIACTNFGEIERALGKTLLQCLSLSTEQKKVNFQRKSQLLELKSSVEKFNLNNFEALKKLGEGQFGTVLLVKDKQSHKLYALKCVSKQQTIKYKLQKHLKVLFFYMKRQRQVLQKISSPFVVNYIRSFKDPYYVYFLMEYINGMELFDTIRFIGLLNIEQSRFYTAIMVQVLETIHSNMIVYRDLKPQNIMVTKDGYLKIVDLGTCKQFESESLHRTFTIIGTPNYMAPQILAGKGYTYNVDLWSLGVILFQFLAGYVPFGQDAIDPFEIYEEILTTNLKFPLHMINQTAANSFISQLLSKSPSLRLGGSYLNLKCHQFFGSFEWSSLMTKEMKAPYILANEKVTSEQTFMKMTTKPVGSFLRFHGKPVGSRHDLDSKWDEAF